MNDRDLQTLFLNAQKEVDLNWRGHNYLYNQMINKPRSSLKSVKKVSLVWAGSMMILIAVVVGGINFLSPLTTANKNSDDYVSLDDYQNLFQVTSNNDSGEVDYNESSEENHHLLSYYEIL